MDTGRGVCIESWLAHSPLPVRYPTSIQPVPYRDTGRAVCAWMSYAAAARTSLRTHRAVPACRREPAVSHICMARAHPSL